MSRFKYTKQFYETDAAYLQLLNAKEGNEAWFKDFFTAVLKHSTPASRLLDAGCGTGVSTAWLQRYRPQIFGIDFSNTYIQQARERGDFFGVMDITRLAFPNGSFDMVCSADALEHVPQLRKALQEVDRVLKPGGVLVLQVPNLSSNLLSLNYRRTSRNILRKCWFYLTDLLRPNRLRTIERFDLDVLVGDKDAYNLMSPIWLRHHLVTRGYTILSFTTYSLFFQPSRHLLTLAKVLEALPIFRHLGGRMVIVAQKGT
ncbi:MAG: class I SAM-dependent methyltransferase [Verrucomicrobia bacterium]|jgi:ubiquinone/menaquinone biosynthesis C-methylase UbiE|nr:class I SAM-dependent methyltransferase [Verrucomicrobiota bacterium]